MQKGYGALNKQQAAKLLCFKQDCVERFLASYLHLPFSEPLSALIAVAYAFKTHPICTQSTQLSG